MKTFMFFKKTFTILYVILTWRSIAVVGIVVVVSVVVGGVFIVVVDPFRSRLYKYSELTTSGWGH